jgi:hypothetical protein
MDNIELVTLVLLSALSNPLVVEIGFLDVSQDAL